MMNLSPEENQEVKDHLKAVARILYQRTSKEELLTFEDIEITLRDEIQELVAPEIAQFFFQKSVKLKSAENDE